MTRDRATWVAIAALGLFAAGFALALVVTDAPPPSAAATIRRTLAALILAPVLLGGAAVAARLWWRRRRRRRRLEDAATEARVYALLQGAAESSDFSARRRPTLSRPRSLGQGGVNIVLPRQTITAEDLARAADATRPERWEVGE